MSYTRCGRLLVPRVPVAFGAGRQVRTGDLAEPGRPGVETDAVGPRTEVPVRERPGHGRGAASWPVPHIVLPRYRFGARWYDTLSGERLVYRAGRIAAIDLLDPHPGAHVLLVGCGTGLDLPLLEQRIGPAGRVTGIDASPWMLDRARTRVARAGWANVALMLADAADPPPIDTPVDCALFSYCLGVIGDWRSAWASATGRLRDGGRVAVVDTDLPIGWARPLRPLARLALWTGGVDRTRGVWQLVDLDTVDARRVVLAAGHIHAAAGTWHRSHGG